MADALNDRIIILGAGQAGARVAEALRDAGHKGTITLVGAELSPPYERPQLSKEMLLDPTREPVPMKSPAEWVEADIRLLTGMAATGINALTRQVTLAGGQVLSYDRLVFATGTRPRRLPGLEGGPVPVQYLRSVEDARTLRARLRHGFRLLVLGGGVIGLEVAAAAIRRGCAVDLVEAAPALLSRAVPAPVSDRLVDRHRAEGVRLHPGRQVDRAVDGGVRLDNGDFIACDLILVGIGVDPCIDLAVPLGIGTAEGIRVDAYGFTSLSGIFAVGDVASQWSAWHGRWLRVETWANAQNQAIATARAMLGLGGPYQDAPWFWSDQYDLNLQACGDATRGDMVLRGDPAGAFSTIHLVDGRINGASSLNAPGDMAALRRLVNARASLAVADLADPGFNLRRAVTALPKN